MKWLARGYIAVAVGLAVGAATNIFWAFVITAGVFLLSLGIWLNGRGRK